MDLKKIINGKESFCLAILYCKPNSCHETIFICLNTSFDKCQMTNDPKADTDRKISSHVLKPEFIPPVQDKIASISKFMIAKITDQREMIYSF